MTRKLAFLLIIVIIVAVLYSGYTSAYRAVVQAQTDLLPFDSPLPTPIPPEAEMALHFVAAQHGIPQDQLAFGSQETLTFPLLGRSYTYVTVHYDAPDGFQLFAVLVDPAAKTVEPDFNAVRAAEEAAYRARYGKLDASNYGRRWVYLPYAAHNADGRTTGFTLRNVSGGHISGYAHYYDPDGTLRISYPFTLASAQVMGRHQSGDGLPNGWVGSILLEASGPILAILREDAPGRSAGYNALVLAP